MLTGRMGRFCVAVVLAALVLAACGGDDDTEAGSPTTSGDESSGTSDGGGDTEIGDLCEIITASDAEMVLGEPVEADPEREAPSAVGQCVWNAVAADSFAQLQFRIHDGGSYYSEPADGAEPLAVGDPGYIRVDDEFGVIDIQFVTNGSLVVTLFASDMAGPIEDARSSMEELATKVADAI
jgi:hypothetical protein